MPAVQLEGEPAAERKPEHVRSPEAQRLDEGGEAIRELREWKGLGRV
jgi:hypothetical protein